MNKKYAKLADRFRYKPGTAIAAYPTLWQGIEKPKSQTPRTRFTNAPPIVSHLIAFSAVAGNVNSRMNSRLPDRKCSTGNKNINQTGKVNIGAQAIDHALKAGGTPRFAGYSKEYQAVFDQFLPLVRAFYTEDFQFGTLARDPLHRQGLVDLLTGIVGTHAAHEVTRTIRAFFDQKKVI